MEMWRCSVQQLFFIAQAAAVVVVFPLVASLRTTGTRVSVPVVLCLSEHKDIISCGHVSAAAVNRSRSKTDCHGAHF